MSFPLELSICRFMPDSIFIYCRDVKTSTKNMRSQALAPDELAGHRPAVHGETPKVNTRTLARANNDGFFNNLIF